MKTKKPEWSYTKAVAESWKNYKEGKSNYKPFSLQLFECRENGDAFLEKCHKCGKELVMCRLYGGQCISSKCKPARIKDEL